MCAVQENTKSFTENICFTENNEIDLLVEKRHAALENIVSDNWKELPEKYDIRIP